MNTRFMLCWNDHKGNPLKHYDFQNCERVFIEAHFVTDNESVPPYLDLMYVDETGGSYPGGWPDNPQQLITMALALKDMCRGFEVTINWESIAASSMQWDKFAQLNPEWVDGI